MEKKNVEIELLKMVLKKSHSGGVYQRKKRSLTCGLGLRLLQVTTIKFYMIERTWRELTLIKWKWKRWNKAP